LSELILSVLQQLFTVVQFLLVAMTLINPCHEYPSTQDPGIPDRQ
jgi:hypothetical protein